MTRHFAPETRSVCWINDINDLVPDDMLLEICPEFIGNLKIPASDAQIYIRLVAAVEVGAAGDA